MTPYEAVEGVLRACAEYWYVLGWIAVLLYLLIAAARGTRSEDK